MFYNTLKNDSPLIDQPKLSYDFVKSLSQNEIKMRNTAFFILDKLTIFTDVDFSIVIDLYVFNSFINMNTKTFDYAIEYLINNNYLVWDEYYKKYYVTEKSHVLISKDSSVIDYPTLHITDWNKFNRLTAIEQRFLHQLILNTYTDDKIIHEFDLHHLLNFYQSNKKKIINKEILQSILKTINKFQEMDLFSLEINRDILQAELISIEGFKLNCLYKFKSIENLSDFYFIESSLQGRPKLYYINDNLNFPLLDSGEDNDNLGLNILIEFKHTFLKRISNVNKKDIVTFYNHALTEYIKAYDYFFFNDIKIGDKVPIFLNEFFFPKLSKFITDAFIKNISFFKNQEPQFFININENKIQLTKNNYQNLLEFFAEKAHPTKIILINYILVKCIINHTKNQHHAQSVLSNLIIENKGFGLIFKNGQIALLKYFNYFKGKYSINLSFETFKEIIQFTIAYGVFNNDEELLEEIKNQVSR